MFLLHRSLLIIIFNWTYFHQSIQQFASNSSTDRIFLFHFFQYYTNVSHKLSVNCQLTTEYFWSNRNQDWAKECM